VIGVKDEKWGERPVAVVVREPQADEMADEGKIADHMKPFVRKGVISKFAIPQQFKFVDQLPKTSVGKLDKKALRKTYGDE
jgi:fatty-acyl-CoA synthase